MKLRDAYHSFTRVVRQRRRRELALLTAATSLASVLEVCGIFLVIPLIRMLHQPTWIHQVPILESAYGAFGFSDERGFILAFAAFALSIFLIRNLYLIGVYRWQRRFAASGVRELTNRLLTAYLFGRYDRLFRLNRSILTRNVRDLVPQINRAVVLGVVNVAAESIAIIGIALVLYFVAPLAAVVVAAVAIAIGVLHFRSLSSRMEEAGQKRLAAARGGNRLLGDVFAAMKEVRLLGREQRYLDRLNSTFSQIAQRSAAQQFANQVMRPINEIIMLAGIIAVLASVIVSSAPGQSLTHLGVLTLASIRLLPSLNRLFREAIGLWNGLPALKRYLNEIDAMGYYGNAGMNEPEPMKFSSELQFENVTYSYPGTSAKCLHLDNLTIKRGQCVGIVGPSGGGKSTLVGLLLGLLTPSSGRILVDGVDLQTNVRGWQALIGYVPQDVAILDDTVRRNIALGIDDDEIDDDRVREVIRIAEIGGKLDAAPNWMDKPLGDQGIKLSAGQKQRIGIARALYHDPEILVFDDATRDLDNRTQQLILRKLRSLPGPRTIILVSHDLATVKSCDQVIFIRSGEFADSGTFEELSAHNPAFRNLVRLGQLGQMPPADLTQSSSETTEKIE